jgi:XTP/dITP diphosphohydrolase
VSFKYKGKVIFFATGNIHKYTEARAVLSEYGLAAAMISMKGIEIQRDSRAEIASTSAANAYRNIRLPLIVEDAGLFVDSLSGFPGPYAAYVYKTIENRGVLKLMETVPNRKATFRSAIAYCDNLNGQTVCFEGESAGEITTSERIQDAKSAFGFDPIFQPLDSVKTFAEMTLPEKNRVSHRAQALRKFAEWYRQQV